MENKLDEIPSPNTILGGDFNCFLNPELDKSKSSPPPKSSSQYRERLKAMLEDKQLSDIWRVRKPNEKGFTFRRGSYASRLDYLFLSEHLSESVTKLQLHPGAHSDHSLLTATVQQDQVSRGPGLWRFDPLLLAQEKFVTQMKDFLTSWSPPPELSDPRTKWEWLKFQIKGFVTSFPKKNKSIRTKTIKDLRSQLETLHQTQDSDDKESESVESVKMEIESITRQLRELEEEQANRAILRSKCKWARLGEKPSKYFLNLEKQQSRGNVLSAVTKDNGDSRN